MDIVIDTCALIAVIVGEPEKGKIVQKTTGHTLIGPGSIPWEVGNAFTAMLKQRRLDVSDALKGIEIFLESSQALIGVFDGQIETEFCKGIVFGVTGGNMLTSIAETVIASQRARKEGKPEGMEGRMQDHSDDLISKMGKRWKNFKSSQ